MTVTVDSLLARIDNLPTLPFVAMRVNELVDDQRTSAKQIADVLRQDVSLSSKVLRLANSSYYSIPGGVTDVPRAISVMGLNTLHRLVLSVSVLGALRTPAGALFDPRGLWLHSLGVGTAAEVIARRIGHPDPSACFTAGLLHDLGKIAVAITEPKAYMGTIELAKQRTAPMHVIERELGYASHERIGVRLGRRWRFPAALLTPIEFHHHDHEALQQRADFPAALLPMVDIVCLADEICRYYKIGDGGSPAPEKHDEAALARLGLLPIHILEIYSGLMRRLETSKIFLELV